MSLTNHNPLYGIPEPTLLFLLGSKVRLDFAVADVLVYLFDCISCILWQGSGLDNIQILPQLVHAAGSEDNGITQRVIEDAVIGRPAKCSRVAGYAMLLTSRCRSLEGLLQLGVAIQVAVNLTNRRLWETSAEDGGDISPGTTYRSVETCVGTLMVAIKEATTSWAASDQEPFISIKSAQTEVPAPIRRSSDCELGHTCMHRKRS